MAAREAKDALEYIRKESLDIYNRLHSIEEDIHFVNLVHQHVSKSNTPLLPNLRCGAWYTNPSIVYDAPAYFKSTDGHFNNWSFNLRRSNLHLLSTICEFGGIALVDSTRSGKRIPDALSKTIPIWCSVINRAMKQRFPDSVSDPWDVGLYTPPHVVSKQEHSAIEAHLDGWATALAKSSYVIPLLPHPLRPLWITPANSTFPNIAPAGSRTFCPIICISASKQIHEAIERRGGFSYVQGSGDDHELWGMGLTPHLFWEHHDKLLSSCRQDLPEVVASIVSASGSTSNSKRLPPTPIDRVSGLISICSISDLVFDDNLNARSITSSDGTSYVIVTNSPLGEEEKPGHRQPPRHPILRLSLAEGKKGQYHFLQIVLPQATSFVGDRLRKGDHVCIACHSGNDSSVGVALAALQKYFDDNGELILDGEPSRKVDKQSIRTRLEWIILSRPQANPSRATLKRVNEFLMTPEAFARGPAK